MLTIVLQNSIYIKRCFTIYTHMPAHSYATISHRIMQISIIYQLYSTFTSPAEFLDESTFTGPEISFIEDAADPRRRGLGCDSCGFQPIIEMT